MSRLQMHPIANDDRLTEGQPRLGTVPVYEFVDGVAIAPLCIWARQTVENRGFRDLKVWQPQNRFGGPFFGIALLFWLHDPWPPAPRVDHAAADTSSVRLARHSSGDDGQLPNSD